VNPGPAELRCILFAVRRESVYFRRSCGFLERVERAPCHAWLATSPAGPLVLSETGIGPTAVESTLKWLLGQPQRPALLVYAGFTGALDDAGKVGDVVLADEVVDEAGKRWATAWPLPHRVATIALRHVRMLTVNRLVASAADKRRLGAQYGAQAVDMEAAHVAAFCDLHGIPFGCARAISDAVDTSLTPSLAALLTGSRVSLPRVVGALVRRPSLLLELIRMQRDTRRAAYHLAIALRDLLMLGGAP
jgi:nucleoside phosphorylase